MKRTAHIIAAFLALIFLVPAGASAAPPVCGKEPSLDRSLHKTLLEVHKSYEKKKYADALQTLNSYAKGRDKLHHRFYFLRGILGYQLNHKKTACRDFEDALKAWPCFMPALRNLANVQYDLGRYKAAALTAGKAYRMSKPPDPELAYMAAIFHITAGQPQKALPYLKTLLKRKKPCKKWMLAMVRARMDLKQWPRAQEVLGLVLRRFPGDAGLWRLSSSLELRTKHYADAAAALEVALHLEKPRKGDWRSLAELHRAAGSHARSAGYFVKAFGPNPTAKEWLTLSRTYVLAQDMDHALVAAEKAVRLDPSWTNQAYLAELLLRKRYYRRAAEAYLEAAAKARKARAGRAARLAMQAGYCSLRRGDLCRALKAFRQAGKMAPKKSKAARNAAKWCQEVRTQQQALLEP